MTQEAIALRTSGDSYPGIAVVQDVNKALATIATDFAGPDDPAALAGPYMTWADTANGLLKRRSESNTAWVTEFRLFDDVSARLDLINPIGSKNVLINSNFSINQRQVSGSVTLAAGAYGHDRFKAGSSGCTYSFSASEGKTTFSISAGSLMQVIEGANLQSGTYCASWEGTAQGRIDGGAYGSSGITGTAIGGVNQTIEWGVGTLSRPQYEPGTLATPWVPYNGIYGGEAQAALRYLWRVVATASEYLAIGQAISASSIVMVLRLPATMRSTPTVGINGIQCLSASGTPVVVNTVSNNGSSSGAIAVTLGMASASFVAGNASAVLAPSGSVIAFVSEL